jgi:malate dehydrogenase
MSAASAVKDHLNSWYFGTPEGEFTSMGIYVQGEPYGVANDLVFSFPV